LNKLLEIRETLHIKYSSSLISAQPRVVTIKNKEDSFVEKVEKIILNHLDKENFSIHELSLELQLSRSQVYRKIKALTGMSPVIYIRHIRFRKRKNC
jgi:AraC-like DNA-binding protein